MLVALGLAVAVGSVAYNFFLSLQRGSISSDERPQPILVGPHPGSPERLPHPEARASAVSAVAHVDRAGSFECSVEVTGLDRSLLGATAGIAAFSARGGGAFHWQPLTAGELRGDGSITLSIRVALDAATLTLAESEPSARHGYLARHDVTEAERSSRAVVFDGVVASTTLQLDTGLANGGPLRLVRVGDLEWRPEAVAPAGLFFESTRTTILLGRGEYELVDPIESEARQRFAVPAPGPILIESRLARPRGRLQ